MTIKFSTQKSTVLPRIPATITDAATRAFLEDVLKHLDRLNRDVRGDFDKIVAGDAALDHGLMFGLADDDHTQYFNTTRGDARFSQLGHDHASAYAALSHAHDDRYFTESESDLRYSLLGHNHDLTYAAIAHNHDLLYSAIGHDHDSDYSAIGHDHDSDYSDIAHNHDLNYSALGHVHNGLYLEIPKFEASNLIVQEPYGETVLNPKICTLTINTIAHFNNYNSKLSCRSFDEESFSIVGNELTISGHAVQSITSLNETDIAVSLWSAGPTRQIRTYRFDGTDWAQVGNSLNRVDLENITAINGTDIATVSTSGTFKNVLRFDGADWTLVGTAQTSYPGVVASLNETDVAFVLNTGSEYVMRTYRFDGNIFTMIGNELALGYDIDDITKVSSVDVAILDYNDLSVRIYRFDGLDWILTSDILDVGAGDAVDVSIIGINGTGLIVANGNSGNLCYYRFCSLAESGVAFYDNISGNVSISAHGYCPKAPNDVTKFLRGDASWNVPPSVSTSAPGYAPKLPNDATRFLNGDGGYTVPNNITPVLKTADYTILDDDGYGLIKVDPTAGNITITLPTAADNNGRIIRIEVSTTGGSVTVDGEGSETIDGLASIVLNRKYDCIEVCSDGTEWTILSGRASYSTGWINTADWTIRELGDMSITYDNKTGTFAVGEEIEEYTTGGTPPTGATGNKWVICADSGTVLRCKEAQGTGFATNDRWVVGKTSGAKAQVNGTSKNLDGVVTHSLGYYPEELDIQIWVGEAAGIRSFNLVPFVSHIGVSDAGLSILSSTDTSIKIQTGYYGIEVMGDNGNKVTVDNEDWYYSILVMKRW